MLTADSADAPQFGALGLLAPCALLMLAVVLSACAGSGTSSKKYEDVYIEQLSRGPMTFSEFRKGVLAEFSGESTRYDMDNADAVGTIPCRDWITSRELTSSFPVVWAAGYATGDVNEVYRIGIHGAGWGGGDLKGDFEIYVSVNGAVIGWHTTVPEWRAVIEPHWR